MILDSNPLQSTENLKTIQGVSARGTWLDHAALRRMVDRLATTFSDGNTIPVATPESFDALLAGVETLRGAGFPYPDYSIQEIEDLYRELGRDALADRVDGLQMRPGDEIETP